MILAVMKNNLLLPNFIIDIRCTELMKNYVDFAGA